MEFADSEGRNNALAMNESLLKGRQIKVLKNFFWCIIFVFARLWRRERTAREFRALIDFLECVEQHVDVEESSSNMFLFMPVVVVEECVEGDYIQYYIF